MAKAGTKPRPKRQPHGHELDASKQTGLNGVTDKEEHFCQIYLIEFSVIKAANSIGIKPATGYDWMTRPHIQKRISQIRQNTAKALDLTRERILQRLSQIIYGDPRKLFKQGKYTNPDKWDDEVAGLIAGIKVNAMTGTVESIKGHDVLRAIETLNKMMGYNAPEIKQIDLTNIAYDKEQLLEIAKMMEGLI